MDEDEFEGTLSRFVTSLFYGSGNVLLDEATPEFAKSIKIFFLGCVILAGLFGAYTVNGKILFIQGAPALITLVLVLLNF